MIFYVFTFRAIQIYILRSVFVSSFFVCFSVLLSIFVHLDQIRPSLSYV